MDGFAHLIKKSDDDIDLKSLHSCGLKYIRRVKAMRIELRFNDQFEGYKTFVFNCPGTTEYLTTNEQNKKVFYCDPPKNGFYLISNHFLKPSTKFPIKWTEYKNHKFSICSFTLGWVDTNIGFSLIHSIYSDKNSNGIETIIDDSFYVAVYRTDTRLTLVRDLTFRKIIPEHSTKEKPTRPYLVPDEYMFLVE